MMRYLFLPALLLASCQSERDPLVLIETNRGGMTVKLYNSTPKHRDNFLKLAEEGYYDGLLFHRVIEGFMIQGGDPDSRGAAAGQILGIGGPGYQIDPEIGAPHFRGALAAARDNNPRKRSSGSQFYIVQGQRLSEEQLNRIEEQKGYKFSPEWRAQYKEKGGAPFLDGDYTVFGELVEGFETLDRIAAETTDPNNRPMEDITMTLKVIKK
jgi:cyclophilin family peptidyl-prolyl cis-trans isomerase